MVVKLQREKIAKCLTCPLCHGLFTEATTIIVCLHTFCKKCINEHIIYEEYNCPVCKKDLGGYPLDKLRYDHSLQSITNKVFGSEGANKPESSVQQSPVSADEKQEKPISESSSHEDKIALLLKAAQSLAKHNLQETINTQDQAHINKVKGKFQSGSAKQKEGQEKCKRPTVLCLPVGSDIGEPSCEVARRFDGTWFFLIASNNQDVDEPLVQLSSPYLRVKDGSMTVSTIKKYIVKNLDLASEEEVELTLRDQPLVSTLTLNDLVEQWIKTGPKSAVLDTSMGSSGKDFVMVIGYGRKAPV